MVVSYEFLVLLCKQMISEKYFVSCA